jgi:hypothetical protein
VGAEHQRKWKSRQMESKEQLNFQFLLPPVQFPQDVKSHAHFFIQRFQVKKNRYLMFTEKKSVPRDYIIGGASEWPGWSRDPDARSLLICIQSRKLNTQQDATCTGSSFIV